MTDTATIYTRRYLFKLYPTSQQAAVLHEQRKMMADLWNALLQRYEDIVRRTQQRQVWYDTDGKRHMGVSLHSLSWDSVRYAHGESVTVAPMENGRPKPFTAYDMQNEITHLCNVEPEWRAMSVWCGHRTAAQLHRAIVAFYSRAASGAGVQSGYPRYRRRDEHHGIPHRFASGCKLSKDPRHTFSWSLRIKGIEGNIHARGAFPTLPEKWTDADVIWRDRRWWISVCVTVEPRRVAGHRATRIEFDLIDCFAKVNGYPSWLPNYHRIVAMQDDVARLQAVQDLRWPRNHPARRVNSGTVGTAFRASANALSHLSARLARVRRNALHVWTSHIVESASDLTIIAPAIKPNTQSPRGDEKHWGANIETVSALNQRTLSQAPATAIAMLIYKAEEAGIRCDVVESEHPVIEVGRELVIAGKTARRARRKLKEVA